MKLTGILTALVTPFDSGGAIDYGALERLLTYQLEQGATGFIPLGATGEFYALTAEERREVLAFVTRTVGGRATLIAGANGGSTREDIEHARRATELGYPAILVSPPYSAQRLTTIQPAIGVIR